MTNTPKAQPNPESQELVITSTNAGKRYWADLWSFRELLLFLAWRDILVRYKQTAVGIIWALGRPLIATIIFAVVFGQIAKLPSHGTPYPLLILAALLPWQFFANAFTGASESLVGNASMISKVYFPRLIVPVSAVIVSLVDLLVSGAILIAMLFWYGEAPTIRILALPLFALLGIFLAIGAGIWVAALNVKYRDFRIIIPFCVQFGLYISPVGFSSDIVSTDWRLIYSLNPIVGVIDGFRWSILSDGTALYWPSVFLSLLATGLLLLTGIWYFRSTERTFADVI